MKYSKALQGIVHSKTSHSSQLFQAVIIENKSLAIDETQRAFMMLPRALLKFDGRLVLGLGTNATQTGDNKAPTN